MGAVYKKQTTRPVPNGAETIERKGERLARWKDAKGKTRTERLTTSADGSTPRILTLSSTWYAKYREHDGRWVERTTECKDEANARQVLAQWEKRVERIRAGLETPAESRMVDRQAAPIADHFDAYIRSLEAAGTGEKHRQNTRSFLDKLAEDCGFARLADLRRDALETWLANQTRVKGGRSARTRNAYRNAYVAFANWCVAGGRLAANPFKGIPKVNEAADPRRKRRAMTEDELTRLLEVARARPLREALTFRRGPRKGQLGVNVRPEQRERLEAAGRQRELVYKTLVLTGLRREELGTLTVGQLRLDAPTPHLELDAADEKNREGNALAIRPDLAADLRAFLDAKLRALQAEAGRAGKPIPASLPGGMCVFGAVTKALLGAFNRDLEAAGIPKRDDRGRTLDVHALRTTFGTLLSKGGVPLRTAQAAMRHSDPKLTAMVYTDPRLLDVEGALDALPGLPLGSAESRARSQDTGTNGPTAVAQSVAQAPVPPCPVVAHPGTGKGRKRSGT